MLAGRRSLWSGLPCLAVVLLLACAPSAQPARSTAPAAPVAPATPPQQAAPAAVQPRETATLRLDWVVNGKLAPFYVAKEKGYYAEEGIDADVLEGGGSGKTVAVVGSGADTFGFADAGAIIRLVGEDVPVQIVADILQKNPMGIFYLESAGIHAPKNLEGKTLSVVPSGSVSPILPAFLTLNGVDVAKVNVLSVDAGAAPAALVQGKMDALGGELVDLITAQGFEPDQRFGSLMFADYGINLLSHGIIANLKTIQEKPDLVRRFVRASLRGWAYAAEQPDEAAEIVYRQFPKTNKDLLLAVLKGNLGLLHSKRTEGKPLGWVDDADMDDSLHLLSQYGGLAVVKPTSTYYTNAFLPNP